MSQHSNQLQQAVASLTYIPYYPRPSDDNLNATKWEDHATNYEKGTEAYNEIDAKKKSKGVRNEARYGAFSP
jgi:hypothetical protein